MRTADVRTSRPRLPRFAAGAACLLLFAAGLAACSAGPPPSFDPSTPCAGADRQQMSGAYADLESHVPAQIGGTNASSVDSGRFCSKATLGSLWDAGLREVHFGGAIYVVGDNGGVQVSVWQAQGLTAQLMADEYKAGAQADSKVSIVSAANETLDGRPGFRLNLVNGDSHQAILVWPSKDGSLVQVVIGADVDETVIQEAVTKLG